MIRRSVATLTLLFFILLLPASARAQTYAFSLDQETVHVYWNEDGTVSLDYQFVFTNEPFASPIDYVDVGLPNSNFALGSIGADVDGRPLSDISASGYQGEGDSGVAVGLGSQAIPPGATGRVSVYVGQVERMLRPDSDDSGYASGVFSPTWFDAKFVTGVTNLAVIFHLPPGVQPEEPRWHQAPSGWVAEPQTGFDDQGRITYSWSNARANGYTQYLFGASFPRQYVPAAAISNPSLWERLNINPEDAIGFLMCFGFAGIMGLVTVTSIVSTNRRKMQYLPPKVAIEGHGVKRGLTAIEAAILLEQPMDKILTMILFAVIKKGAATVSKREPLKLQINQPLPDGLYEYEKDFLNAFATSDLKKQRKMLQDLMVQLVKGLSTKLKGFSRKETVAYYKDIVRRAWLQVEAADTPEVKSQKYDEVMEWTMLDRDYDDRTRRVFQGGPVFVPMWWPRYDPVYRGGAPVSRPIATSTPTASPGGSVSLPHLPGSDFAASVVGGVQNFSSNVIGNLTDFTSGVTNRTNPVPKSTSSSGRSGGGGCACACACAGCACACAGGGR